MIIKLLKITQEQKDSVREKEMIEYDKFEKDLFEVFKKHNAVLTIEPKEYLREKFISITIKYQKYEFYGNLREK
jgi:hypothetical protein